MSTCQSGKWPSRVSNGDIAAPAPQAQPATSDEWLANCPQEVRDFANKLKAAPQPAQELTGCACRWDADDNRVATCVRHHGWLDVVHEWAERAKAADVALQSAQPAQENRYISIERVEGFPSKLENGPQPVLYSDSINGCMVRRDDVWLALTSQLRSAQPVATQGDFKEWVSRAYREPHSTFTIHNMEVAFTAGKQQANHARAEDSIPKEVMGMINEIKARYFQNQLECMDFRDKNFWAAGQTALVELEQKLKERFGPIA